MAGKRRKKTEVSATEVIEFAAEDVSPASSGSFSSRSVSATRIDEEREDATSISEDATAKTEEERSPVFKLLAEPTLPELKRENRARLQMQSPNRLNFYWSLKENPFKNLNRILGAQAANYTLVLKLIDLGTEEENVHPVDAEGSWWFDVEADRRYRAEIGLFAINRPYIRILFSNTIDTPRRAPSPRPAETAEWRVTADKFSKVLDVSGFSRDAFDVALAGDESELSDLTARIAFDEYFRTRTVRGRFSAADLRLVLLTIAAGGSIASLRGRIGPALFSLLERSAVDADAERASSVLSKQYDIEAGEFDVYDEEDRSAGVFGASLVSFPRRLRTSRRITEYSPLSSFSVAAN